MPTHSLYLTTSRIPYSVGSVSTSSILGIESQAVYNLVSVPLGPTILNVLTADSQILILFAPNNPDENSIITDYQYSIDGGNTFITMPSINTFTTASSYIISNLTNGVTYQIQVKALNAIGEGNTSNIISVTPSTTPSAVTINSISAGDGTAYVDFMADSNGGSEITNYKYSIDNGVTFSSFSPEQTTNPLTITDLTNGNTYDIVIKAVNFNGDGIASNSQSVVISPFNFAVDYFPLIADYNNNKVSTTSLLASTPENVSIANILTKSCVTFTSNAYLISNSITLQLPISFCFWCYIPTLGPTNQVFSIGDGSFAGSSACLQTDVLNNGSFNIYIGLPSFWTSLSVSSINNNKWSHLCYTISSTNAILYVDGVSRATTSGTFSWKTLTSYKYVLGRAADGSSRYLNNGGIRHFARFNKILTLSEISDIISKTS